MKSAVVRRRILWASAVLLVVAAPATLYGIRVHRVSRLRAVVEARRAAGQPSSLEDLRRLVPRLDAAVQERFGAALRRLGALEEKDVPHPGEDGATDRAVEDWIVGAAAAPPAGLREAVERCRAPVEEVTAIAREGRAVSSLLGWLPPRRPVGPSIAAAGEALEGSQPIPAARALRWHGYAALLGDDPEARLADIDALLATQSPPGGAVDALFGPCLRAIRDRTHLGLALQGRLPPGRRGRYLAEDPDELALLADALRAESGLFAGLLAEGFLEGQYPAWSPLWIFGPTCTAETLEVQDAAERILRGQDSGTTIPRLQERADGGASFGVPLQPLLVVTARGACIGRARGRAARLALRLLGLHGERGRLPADEAEARAWLGPAAAGFDPGPLDLRLAYERPAENRLRIAVDPASAPPLLVEDWGDSPPDWILGKPPSARPFVLGPEGVEIRVPASRR